MIQRRYLESLRENVRKLKWMAADATSTKQAIAGKAAWCADYISELLEHMDDDVILRSNVSKECVMEVRANQMPTKAKEIEILVDMLNLTKDSFHREKIEEKKEPELAIEP